MARAYCLTCDHRCHCVGSGYYPNTTECGCGCFTCTCTGLPLKLEETNMIKKFIKWVWNIICWPWKKLVEWLWTRQFMANKPLSISESAAVQMPMKTVASLIIIVALGTMGYFNMVERLNQHSTRLELMEKDLTENTDFRIKWPRGQLGSLPADSEQYMMIEDLYKTTDKLNKHIENMALNKVNIEFLRKQMDKVLEDIEKLKDANREIGYKNGSYSQ